MKNKNLRIEVRNGSVRKLFPKKDKIPFKVDALIGFLPVNGQWLSSLDLLIQQSIAGNPSGEALPYGRISGDAAGHISHFHRKADMSAITLPAGGACYANGHRREWDSLDFAFYDIVWGIVQEPEDIRLALSNAIVLAAKQKASDVTELVLPWYGTKETVVPSDENLTQHEKKLVAQAWTVAQVQGLQEAAKRLEHSVVITIFLPKKEGIVNWQEEFSTAADLFYLNEVAEMRKSRTVLRKSL